VVARPGVRLQLVVAVEERSAAAEPVAAALRDHADLAPAHAAVLGHVIAREDLHFLQRIDVLDPDDRAVRPRPDRRGAVDGDVVLVAAAAVDAEAAVAEVGEVVVVEVAADDPRLEADDADRVAAVERKLLDVLRFDRLAQRDVGLERSALRRDRHRFGDRAGFEREIERQRARCVERDVLPERLLEALQLRADVVLARRQVRERVEPRSVGDGRRLDLRLRILRDDGGTGYHGTLCVPDSTGDLAPVELSGRWHRKRQHARDHGAAPQYAPEKRHIPSSLFG